jgi:hypothetical protein
MKHEIWNGKCLGTAEFVQPGEVRLEIDDPASRSWFERYFGQEQSYLTGAVDCPEMTSERPADSEAAFNRALERLPAHNYDVRSPTTSLGPSSKASAW